MPDESNEYNDLPIEELIRQANIILAANPNADVYVKWTCPNCGERAMSDEANTFHTGGYLHEDCGYTYTGNLFGFMLSIKEPFRRNDD